MHVDCLHCGARVKVVDAEEGDWIECPSCEAEVKVPTTALKRSGRSNSGDMQPIIVPVVVSSDEDAELAEERKLDIRETRRFRQEDRAGNPIGTVGFAIGVTTLLFLFGAVVLHRFLPLYLWFVAVLSVPSALFGLVFSIVGSLLVGRPKLFSYIGAGIGAFLILIGLPISFLLLKGF